MKIYPVQRILNKLISFSAIFFSFNGVYTYNNRSHIWIWSRLIKVDHSSVMTIIYLFIHVFYSLQRHWNWLSISWKNVFNLILFQWKKIHLLPLKMTQHFLWNHKKSETLFNAVALSTTPTLYYTFFLRISFHTNPIEDWKDCCLRNITAINLDKRNFQ